MKASSRSIPCSLLFATHNHGGEHEIYGIGGGTGVVPRNRSRHRVRSRQQQIGLGWLDIVSERLQHVGRKRQLEPQQPEQLGKLQQQVRTSVSTEKCSARAV